MTKKQLKRVNRKLSRRTVDAPSTGHFREASSGPEKSLVPHGLVEKKKANFVDSRKLLLRGYKFKDTKNDRFGKRSVATEAEEIDDRSTEADVNALRRSIKVFFLFSTSSSNNFRFAFLALKVASQAFTRKISICSAKINHVLRCSLSRELWGELACGPLFEVLHRSCSWLNLRSSALPSAGFVRRLESLSWKVRLGPQSYSICRLQAFLLDDISPCETFTDPCHYSMHTITRMQFKITRIVLNPMMYDDTGKRFRWTTLWNFAPTDCFSQQAIFRQLDSCPHSLFCLSLRFIKSSIMVVSLEETKKNNHTWNQEFLLFLGTQAFPLFSRA